MIKTPAQDELADAVANNMNCHEGHLGGYIMSSNQPAPSGLNIEHGDPATWTPELWSWMFHELSIRSVLDVGCGEGHCAAYFAGLGCDVLGIDGSRQAAKDSAIPGQHIVHDFVYGPHQLNHGYDLVWSCEFVEHVEEQYSDNFLEMFSNAKKYLVITYAEPGQPGWHHVNCQPAGYWVDKLSAIGFNLDVALTNRARQIAKTGHFAAKGLVFRPV